MMEQVRNVRALGIQRLEAMSMRHFGWLHRTRAAVTLMLLLGCTTRDNPRYCGDGTCTDPAYPFCDVNGTLGGLKTECIAPSCSPTEFAECRGDNELRCNATGDGYDEIACDAGCEVGKGCANSSYSLVSIEPRIAPPGTTLMLEGSFGSSVVVNFPGGVTQSATRLGDQRAAVVVPDTATAGDLSVTTGGVTVGRVAFRRTTFEMGLQSFLPSYDQAGGARQTSRLSIARSGATSVIVKDYLYLLGGSGGGLPLSSIERAAINADGSLGMFAAVPVVLVTPRAGHASIVVGDYLYVLGGSGSGGALASVERAPIAVDGSLGAFATVSSTSLTVPRKLASTAVIGTWLYVFGGKGTDTLRTVERAQIHLDGSLGAFAAVPDVALVIAREGHTSAVIGDALFMIGGSGSTGPLNTLEFALIRSDGSLGPFAPVSGVALTSSRTGHTSVVLGKQLYVIGGRNTSGALASVEQASINLDNTLGSFTLSSSLASARSDHASAIIGNSFYVVGGNGGGDLKSLERASIDSSGGVGAFAVDSAATMVAGRQGHTSTVIGNYLYVVGGVGDGSTYLTSIERATIHPDGSVGPFAAIPGVALNIGRFGHTSAILGNYLYVIGGVGGGYFLKSIERAAINPDGSLGPFGTVLGVNLVTPRLGHTSAVLGSYLYIFAGETDVGSIFQNSVERATIYADGSLAPFSTVSVTLVTPRYNHSSAVIGSSLYVIGGSGGGGAFGSVERAVINNDGSLGPFQTVSGLVKAHSSHTSFVIGKFLYVVGGYDNQGIFERSEIGAGSLGAFSVAAGSLSRFASTSAVLGNTIYILGGSISGTPLNSIVRTTIQ